MKSKEGEIEQMRAKLSDAVRTKQASVVMLKAALAKQKTREGDLEVSEARRRKAHELVKAYKTTEDFRKKKMEVKIAEKDREIDRILREHREKIVKREKLVCGKLERCMRKIRIGNSNSKLNNNNVDNDDILSNSTTNNMHSSQSPSPVSPMSSSFSTTVNLTGVTAIPISTTAKQHVNSVKIADYLEHAIEALLRNSCSSSNITNNNNNNNHSQLTIANSTSVSKFPTARKKAKEIPSPRNNNDSHLKFASDHLKLMVAEAEAASSSSNAILAITTPPPRSPSSSRPSSVISNPFDEDEFAAINGTSELF